MSLFEDNYDDDDFIAPQNQKAAPIAHTTHQSNQSKQSALPAGKKALVTLKVVSGGGSKDKLPTL